MFQYAQSERTVQEMKEIIRNYAKMNSYNTYFVITDCRENYLDYWYTDLNELLIKECGSDEGNFFEVDKIVFNTNIHLFLSENTKYFYLVNHSEEVCFKYIKVLDGLDFNKNLVGDVFTDFRKIDDVYQLATFKADCDHLNTIQDSLNEIIYDDEFGNGFFGYSFMIRSDEKLKAEAKEYEGYCDFVVNLPLLDIRKHNLSFTFIGDLDFEFQEFEDSYCSKLQKNLFRLISLNFMMP